MVFCSQGEYLMKHWFTLDLALIANTFALIFLAEMGDKTQLMAMTQAARSGKPLSVILGAGAALVSVTVLGVVLGAAVGKWFPEMIIKKVAAVVFVVFGVLMWLGKM